MRHAAALALLLAVAAGCAGPKVDADAEPRPVTATTAVTFPDIPLACVDVYGRYIGPLYDDPADLDEPAEQDAWVQECKDRSARG